MSQMSKPIGKAKKKNVPARGIVHRKTAHAATSNIGGGMVNYWVHRPFAKLTAQEFTPSKLIKALKAGFPVAELDDLQSNLYLPMDKLAPMLGISKATLHRRKNAGRLDAAESDRVLRFARILGRAAEVMESLENGRHWLTSPQVGLGGAVPLEYAETEVGAREVEDLLGRIEYGVYS
jgi:putative toxin-antitoxin system antitoxin component (TIGR02293 family)